MAFERLKRAIGRHPGAAGDGDTPPASSGKLDIRQIVDKAMEFQDALNAFKAQIQPAEFEWYPYDTWTNLFPLIDLLQEDRRFLLDLIGDDPVLDIGCADGALSFFFESLGYKVHAIDYPETNHNDMRGVRALKAALDSSVEIFEVDLDSQFTLPHDHYGLVFLLGVLYHLKNPYYVMETLAKHATHCFLSTRIARFTPDKGINFRHAPVAYLLEEREANDDPSNYWVFSEGGLRRLLRRTGWEICAYMTTGNTADSDPATGDGDERAFCLLKRRPGGPESNAQLLTGWHSLEQGAWRWTEQQFSVLLKIPVGTKPSTLRLKFLLPKELLDRLHALTLAATVNGVHLPAETYKKPGFHIYARTVPAAALAGRPARVDFRLNRALPPEDADRRERGLVGIYVWLE